MAVCDAPSGLPVYGACVRRHVHRRYRRVRGMHLYSRDLQLPAAGRRCHGGHLGVRARVSDDGARGRFVVHGRDRRRRWLRLRACYVSLPRTRWRGGWRRRRVGLRLTAHDAVNASSTSVQCAKCTKCPASEKMRRRAPGMRS